MTLGGLKNQLILLCIARGTSLSRLHLLTNEIKMGVSNVRFTLQVTTFQQPATMKIIRRKANSNVEQLVCSNCIVGRYNS